MGQIIGKTGVVEMGVGEMGVIHFIPLTIFNVVELPRWSSDWPENSGLNEQ